MSTLNELLSIRPAVEGDHAYIYETWLADLRENDHSFLPNDVWFPAHRECIRRVLTSPAASAFVLCDNLKPDIIVGYIVFDADYLHWIHIRRGQWRNRGLARHLLTETQSLSRPLVWKTKLGQLKLRNQLKSRSARHRWWSMASPR